MDEINYSFKPTEQVPTFNFKPNYNICFHNNGQEIGKLDFNGPALVFTGDAEESAKVFIDWIAGSFAGRLEQERKTEREACHALRQTLPNPHEHCQVSAHAYDMAIAAYGAAIRARGNT